MMELIKKRQHREPLELQLTAMIDIFSMMVIFLIFGTVIGAAEMVFPAEVKPPLSTSKESTESAPQATIVGNKVLITGAKEQEYPLSTFTGGPDNPELQKFVDNMKAYLAALPKEAKSTGHTLNVIADKDLEYKVLFDVIRAFRVAGFESLLFITQDAGSR